MTTETLATLDTPALDSQGADLVRRAEMVTITDDETFREAAELLKLVKAYLTEAKTFMRPLVAAAHRNHQLALAKLDGLTVLAAKAEAIIKPKLADYQQEQERLRREAEEAAQRMQELLEAQERERVAAERLRLQREAEERQLAAAMEKEQTGDVQAMERILAAPIAIPTVAPRPVFLPPVAVQAAPKVDGVSFREVWDFEVVAASQIPPEYLVPDLVAIRKVVQALKGKTAIAGIRVFTKPVTSVRG